MSSYLSAAEAAHRLGISEDNLMKLVDQEILRPKKEPGGYLFEAADILRIVSNKDPTLSEEAAQVGIQIQQEVAYSVSALQRLLRRISVLGGTGVVCLLLSVGLVTALFKLYPRQTSDFFGYYYRFNGGGKASIFNADSDSFRLLGVTAAQNDTVNQNISLAASLTKPVAAVSLLVVKATDGQEYKQIVQAPVAVTTAGPSGSQGPRGVSGLNGQSGLNGLDGQPGLTGAIGLAGADGAAGSAGANGSNGADGAAGSAGANGSNGADGADGTNGTNGTSVADVTTTPGDIIIRDVNDVTARLGAGSNGQVLTIDGSIPSWINASGLTAETDTLASVTARGTSTSANLIFSGGLTFSGTISLSGLTNCQTLSTNASGTVQCGSFPSSQDGATAFTDNSPAALSDNDTTELFNDSTKPSITPTSSSQTVLVSVHVRFTGGGNKDTDAAVRIVRRTGSAANCSSSTQVGDSFSAFLTNATDIQNASGTFLDSPGTTSQVFYTVCSSSNSKLGNNPSSNRIDVTLLRIGG